MIFRKEEVHLTIITNKEKPAFVGKRAVGLQIVKGRILSREFRE